MDENNKPARKEMIVLLSQEVREINFYGDVLLVALVDGVPYVALRPIVDFIGTDWASQYQRLQRDDILDEERRLVVMASADGRQREMVSLPLELLPGWIFGITGSRFKDSEKAAKLKRYRRECFKALWREFGEPSATSPRPTSPTALVQIRDLGLAVAQMAEEQMALQEQVESVTVNVDRAHTRLDRAAAVVGNLQRRLTVVEHRVMPHDVISDEQATEISLVVKALAELLTRQEVQKNTDRKTPNYYQGIFAELYRRFGVTKYTLIRQEDYQSVLAFLSDWRKATHDDLSD
jgi:hypothetical protein